jgi:hypothetical protein
MLLYFTVMATVNLCAGYALGVWLGSPFGAPASAHDVLPPLPKVARAKKEKAKPVEIAKPQATEVAVAEPEVAVEEVVERATPKSISAAAEAESPDVVANLAAFREQLAAMGRELRDSTTNDEVFDACAVRMQAANHTYLDGATQALEVAEQQGVTAEAKPAHEALRSGTEEISTLSTKFDELIAPGLTPETREQLLEKSDQISVAADRLEVELQPEPIMPFDPLSTLATVQDLVGQLFDLCGEATVDAPALVAAIRLDPLAGGEPNAKLEQRIMDKLPAVLGSHIDPSHLSADDSKGQLLCVFPGERLDQLSQRVEHMRQLVEAADFMVDGAPLQATVSCAIAETTERKTPGEMLTLLDEAFQERDRLGVNRTYHHDGAFPTPLPPADVKVERQTVLV